MTIFSNLINTAARAFNADQPQQPVQPQQQQQEEHQPQQPEDGKEEDFFQAGSKPSEAANNVDEESKQITQALISSFARLTDENEDDDDDIICGASADKSMELVHPHHHHLHDEGMHGLDDEEDEEANLSSGWNLDGSHDCGNGSSPASGLGSGNLTPFTSRAHAAAAFGRLAKRAITFGDLIAAVDCFTAAYGQLEPNEQRIVIARMYFLNRQLLYCQHDIIRQKQALAIAALAEQQAKMLEAGHDIESIKAAQVLAGSADALAAGSALVSGSPDYHFQHHQQPYRGNSYRTSSSSYFSGMQHSQQPHLSQFFRSMMAAEQPPNQHYGGMMSSSDRYQQSRQNATAYDYSAAPRRPYQPQQQQHQQPLSNHLDLAMAATSPSAMMKPGVPLVQLPRRGADHLTRQQQQAFPVNNFYQHANAHHPFNSPLQSQHFSPQSQQPVRLDAKHLLLWKFLQQQQQQNNNAGTQSPALASNDFNMLSNKQTGSKPTNRQIDVGIQVCMPGENEGTSNSRTQNKDQQTKPRVNTTTTNNNNNNKGQARNRRGNNNVPAWLPEGEGSELMMNNNDAAYSQTTSNLINDAGNLMAALMMPQPPPPQPPRRPNPNRGTHRPLQQQQLGKSGVSPFGSNRVQLPATGNDFATASAGGFFDNDVALKQNNANRAAAQQQQQQNQQQVNNLIEQLMANVITQQHSTTNNSKDHQPTACPAQQPSPRSNPPASTTQQAALLSRPLRRFDNIDGDSESLPSKPAQQPLATAQQNSIA